MKNYKWLAGCLALALGSLILAADLSYAQPRGRRAWCPNAASQTWGQTWGQGWGQGWGPGNVNCINYPGYRQGQAWSGNPQGRGPRGPRGGRFAPAPNFPASTP